MTEKNEYSSIDLNNRDIGLLHLRVAVIIRLIETGRLDPETGLELFEAQKRPDVILEERKAYSSSKSTHEDSPLGRLLMNFTRLNPDPEQAKKFQRE